MPATIKSKKMLITSFTVAARSTFLSHKPNKGDARSVWRRWYESKGRFRNLLLPLQRWRHRLAHAHGDSVRHRPNLDRTETSTWWMNRSNTSVMESYSAVRWKAAVDPCNAVGEPQRHDEWRGAVLKASSWTSPCPWPSPREKCCRPWGRAHWDCQGSCCEGVWGLTELFCTLIWAVPQSTHLLELKELCTLKRRFYRVYIETIKF